MTTKRRVRGHTLLHHLRSHRENFLEFLDVGDDAVDVLDALLASQNISRNALVPFHAFQMPYATAPLQSLAHCDAPHDVRSDYSHRSINR